MDIASSIQIASSTIQQLLTGIETHIKSQQVLKLMDQYVMRQGKSFVNQLIGNFNTQPQAIHMIHEQKEPPKARIDPLATSEVKREWEESKSVLNENITDNHPERKFSLKRKGSSISTTQPHKFNKAAEGAVPLDLEKIENEKRGEPIRKTQDFVRRTIDQEKGKHLDKKSGKKQGEEFTFQFDGAVLPIQAIHPKISVPKANSKLISVCVESKTHKIPEVAQIKPKRLLDKRASRMPSDRPPNMDLSTNIPLPVVERLAKDQQKGISYKDFSENKGGKFRRISASSQHTTVLQSSRQVVQPEKEVTEKSRIADSKTFYAEEGSKHMYQKTKFTLPKLKGKYNPIDSISNKVV